MTATTEVDTAEAYEAALVRLGACDPALKWSRGKTLAQAWETCEHPSWLRWLAIAVNFNCEFVNTAYLKACATSGSASQRASIIRSLIPASIVAAALYHQEENK